MRIPMFALFREPTVAAMARVVMDQDWPMTAELATPLRKRGTLPPLLCVASPEVNTVGYSILCRYLHTERPVYVLQVVPDGDRVRRLGPPEIPTVARTYIESMREIQPDGPYHLLGMCGGAQITIEMCRMLEEEGIASGFVGILDTWAFYTLSRLFYVKKAIDRARYYRERIVELRSLERGARIQAVRKAFNGRLKAVTPQPAPQPGPSQGQPESPATPITYSVIEEVGWPTDQPDTRKFGGVVTVFKQKNRQQYWRIRDAELGWGRHAERVELIPLTASDHTEIFREPYVRDLARDLEACLATHGSGRDEITISQGAAQL